MPGQLELEQSAIEQQTVIQELGKLLQKSGALEPGKGGSLPQLIEILAPLVQQDVRARGLASRGSSGGRGGSSGQKGVISEMIRQFAELGVPTPEGLLSAGAAAGLSRKKMAEIHGPGGIKGIARDVRNLLRNGLFTEEKYDELVIEAEKVIGGTDFKNGTQLVDQELGNNSPLLNGLHSAKDKEKFLDEHKDEFGVFFAENPGLSVAVENSLGKSPDEALASFKRRGALRKAVLNTSPSNTPLGVLSAGVDVAGGVGNSIMSALNQGASEVAGPQGIGNTPMLDILGGVAKGTAMFPVRVAQGLQQEFLQGLALPQPMLDPNTQGIIEQVFGGLDQYNTSGQPQAQAQPQPQPQGPLPEEILNILAQGSSSNFLNPQQQLHSGPMKQLSMSSIFPQSMPNPALQPLNPSASIQATPGRINPLAIELARRLGINIPAQQNAFYARR